MLTAPVATQTHTHGLSLLLARVVYGDSSFLMEMTQKQL